MASIYAGIREVLGGDPGVSALAPIDRINMFQNQSTELPAIVIYSPSGQMSEDLEKGSAPPWFRRVSVECRGSTYQQADDLGEAVIERLNGFQGVVDRWLIDRCMVISDVPLSDDNVSVRRRVIDFRVVYQPNN